MAITKNAGRQEVIAAKLTVTYADPANDDGTVEGAINVPAGAIVVGGYINVTTAFDSTTSDVVDVGDGVDPDRYTASPVNLQSTGRTALTLTGYEYPATDDIDIGWTAGATGTATAGSFDLVVEYIVSDRAAFSQG